MIATPASVGHNLLSIAQSSGVGPVSGINLEDSGWMVAPGAIGDCRMIPGGCWDRGRRHDDRNSKRTYWPGLQLFDNGRHD